MQCKAHLKSGKQCQKYAIKGGAVCGTHGGGAPQVKRSAALRLAALVDPAIGVLATVLKQRKDKRLAFSAAQDVLNRNGYKSADEIRLKGAGPEGVIEVNVDTAVGRLASRIAGLASRIPAE